MEINSKKQVLAIPNQPAVLSKEQFAFNKKLENIKLLQKELQRLSDGIPKAIQQLDAILVPFEPIVLKLKTERVIELHNYTQIVKFSKQEKNLISEYIKDELIDIFNHTTERNERLLGIFKMHADMTFAKHEKIAQNQTKQFLKSMFGVDIENKEGSTKDFIAEAAKKLFEKQIEEVEIESETPKARKKSKSETLREEKLKQAEDLKKKSIREIYIEMIKIFHPDTESDPDKKREKEDISKQLTVAYQNNDIFTLLKIETEYLQADSDRIAKISTDKIKIYLEVLLSQEQKLKTEVSRWKYENRLVYENMFYKNSKPEQFLQKQKNQRELDCEALKQQTDDIKEFNPKLKHIILEFAEKSMSQKADFMDNFPFPF